MTFNFLNDLVRLANLLVLDVDHRIDEMLPLEWAETILPAKAGEDRAVVKSSLSIEIEFRGPPRFGPVLELSPEGMKIVAAALRPNRGKVLHLQAPWLL